jgi:hypothetical protein
MEIERGLALFAAGFLSVFFLAFQSRCVNSGHRWLFSVNSLMIAIGQAWTWRIVAAPDSGWIEIAIYGAAGACGTNAAVSLHHAILKRDARRGHVPQHQGHAQ